MRTDVKKSTGLDKMATHCFPPNCHKCLELCPQTLFEGLRTLLVCGGDMGFLSIIEPRSDAGWVSGTSLGQVGSWSTNIRVGLNIIFVPGKLVERICKQNHSKYNKYKYDQK